MAEAEKAFTLYSHDAKPILNFEETITVIQHLCWVTVISGKWPKKCQWLQNAAFRIQLGTSSSYHISFTT